MFLKVVAESLTRNPRRILLAVVVLLLASAVTAATLTVELDAGDRLAQEFRSLGANILVTPRDDGLALQIGGLDYRPVTSGRYLREDELGRLKTIFWAPNIIGFTPFLDVPVRVGPPGQAVATTVVGTWYRHAVAIPGGGEFVTGLEVTHPGWQVRGRWFADGAAECVVGAALAARRGIVPGQTLRVESDRQAVELTVVGLLERGGSEEAEAILAPLAVAQRLAGRPGEYRRLLVTAFTKPEDAFAQRDPNHMTATEYERWYCSAYPETIARQINDALTNADARPVRRIAETQGEILRRIGHLFWLMTLGAVLAAALAVAAMAASSVVERRAEVALMKALGAGRGLVAGMFLAELLAVAVVGGLAGFLVGSVGARELGRVVFGVPASVRPVLLPIVVLVAAAISAAGALASLRRLVQIDPARVLRGE